MNEFSVGVAETGGQPGLVERVVVAGQQAAVFDAVRLARAQPHRSVAAAQLSAVRRSRPPPATSAARPSPPVLPVIIA
jgi:hypothetical protein